MKGSRAVEALTNAADDSREIGWCNLPRTWQTCCFHPFSWHPRSPASSKMPFASPSQTQKSTRGSAVSRAIRGVPHKGTTNFWEKQVRKAKITSYISNVSWKTFKFLLPAASEARNKTSHHPKEQHNCGLPARSWGQAAHTCPGCSCCHGSCRETRVSASFGSQLCCQQCLRAAKVHSGSPHLSRSLLHTRCRSGCSFSPLRSLTQTAPNRFEKLPHVPASLPQVQRQMSQTNLFTGWPCGCVKINPHNQSLLSALVQNREFGNFRICCKKQSLQLLSSLLWSFCSAHLLVSASS